MAAGLIQHAIVIPTKDRAEDLAACVERLSRQTRPPCAIVISVTGEEDIGALKAEGALEILFSKAGTCAQRNTALQHLEARMAPDGLITFLDDDFCCADNYFAKVQEAFAAMPALYGAEGLLLADGAKTPGITWAEADAIIAAHTAAPTALVETLKAPNLYGCNATYRAAAIKGFRFDERLVLYGWLEDLDLAARVRKSAGGVNGRILGAKGVHLGVKRGRMPGARYGYSQVANVFYLLGKGSIPPKAALRLMGRPLVMNMLRYFAPEPFIDRRGRLAGNLRAFVDLLTGRMAPERILDL